MQCQEVYEDNQCPKGHSMVSMKNQCGDDREGCVDCSQIVTNERTKDHPDDSDDCYEKHQMTILGVCQHTT